MFLLQKLRKRRKIFVSGQRIALGCSGLLFHLFLTNRLPAVAGGWFGTRVAYKDILRIPRFRKYLDAIDKVFTIGSTCSRHKAARDFTRSLVPADRLLPRSIIEDGLSRQSRPIRERWVIPLRSGHLHAYGRTWPDR